MQTKNGKIGYACIDLTIEDTFKTCRLKTFHDKGLNHINELCLHNAKLLYRIIENNGKNNILMYRISSNLFPWFHLYELEKLPNWEEIKTIYYNIGKLIDQYKMRVSFHPDHFTVIGSENPKTVENSIKDLNHHSFILNLMNRPKNHLCKINVHISNTKPDKESAIKRFIENFQKLDSDTQNRLTIENDDNKNGYTVKELYSVYEKIGTPIVFDTLHYNCNKGDQTYEEALNMACDTWHVVTPTAHHSSSKTIEHSNAINSAHSDYIYEPFNYCGRNVDVMLEAKAKNLALKKYYEEFC
jgi:UV DNA damage endonuclease